MNLERSTGDECTHRNEIHTIRNPVGWLLTRKSLATSKGRSQNNSKMILDLPNHNRMYSTSYRIHGAILSSGHHEARGWCPCCGRTWCHTTMLSANLHSVPKSAALPSTATVFTLASARAFATAARRPG
jgi:hypothetical protein